jgi:cytoskeletal protein CcmA (bactofilin family)
VAVDPRSHPAVGGEPHVRRGGTMIGPNTRVSGELSGDEDVVVDGRVEGTVRLKKQLTVGPAGEVHAEVFAKTVLIAGKVVGNVTAEEKVEIVATGSLEGNIRAAKIVIAEGAHFKGTVDMGNRDGGSPKDSREAAREARDAATVSPAGSGAQRTVEATAPTTSPQNPSRSDDRNRPRPR